MNEEAARILASLVTRYGTSVALDPLRCEGLLRDTCPKCHREIFVLVNAVRKQVPADLLTPRHSLPPSLFRGFLVKRLQDELGFSDEAAHWAVNTWAVALGLDGNSGSQGQVKVTGYTAEGTSKPVSQRASGTTTPEQRSEWAKTLESGSPESRLAAITTMGYSLDIETIRLLITVLENSSWKVREAAFDRLLELGEPTIPPLIEALGDSHETVVTSATIALGALRAKNATAPLITLLDKGGRPLSTLIWALGEIRDDRAITPLTKLLKSSDPQVRSDAEQALMKFK